MANTIRFKRGSTIGNAGTPASGEPLFDTSNGKLYVGDGSTSASSLTAISDDKLPLSGGTLTGGLSGTTATFSSTVRIPHDTTDALRIGASDDLELWHNGTDSAVTNANTGKLYLWNYANGDTVIGSDDVESAVFTGANTTLRGTLNVAGASTFTGNAEFNGEVLISGTSDSPLAVRNTSGGEMFLKFLNTNGTINGAIVSNSNSNTMAFRAGGNTFLSIDGTGQPTFQTTTSNDTTFSLKKTTNGGGNASLNIIGRREAVNSDCSAINFKNTYSGSDRLIGNIIANTVDGNGLSGKLRLRTSNGGTVSDALILNHDTSAEFTGHVTIDGATHPILKLVGDPSGESTHIQLHRSNGQGFTIYDDQASLRFRADLSGSNPQMLQLKSDQSATFFGEKICLNPADNTHLVRTGFHGKTLSTSYTDVFGFITQNDHEGIYYEIIITGGDWGSHSAHRGRFTGFINGHDGYNGHYPIHNHQAWGSTQLNVTWSGSTNNRTAKLQMKITRALGSADSPAKIYYKFVGRQITFYKY